MLASYEERAGFEYVIKTRMLTNFYFDCLINTESRPFTSSRFDFERGMRRAHGMLDEIDSAKRNLNNVEIDTLAINSVTCCECNMSHNEQHKDAHADVYFRCNTIKKHLEQTSCSRGWFRNPQSWKTFKTKPNTPMDVVRYGQIVQRNGVGVYENVFPKIASEFKDYVFLTRLPNCCISLCGDTFISDDNKKVPVVDSRYVEILCDTCGENIGVSHKAVIFNPITMRFADLNNDEELDDEQPSHDSECYLLTSALIVDSRTDKATAITVRHISCNTQTITTKIVNNRPLKKLCITELKVKNKNTRTHALTSCQVIKRFDTHNEN